MGNLLPLSWATSSPETSCRIAALKGLALQLLAGLKTRHREENIVFRLSLACQEKPFKAKLQESSQHRSEIHMALFTRIYYSILSREGHVFPHRNA